MDKWLCSICGHWNSIVDDLCVKCPDYLEISTTGTAYLFQILGIAERIMLSNHVDSELHLLAKYVYDELKPLLENVKVC